MFYLQSFAPDDYRNVRFTDATRYVNKNWGMLSLFVQFCAREKLKQCLLISYDNFCSGIDLIAEVPPKECTERVVFCDGGDPHLGHPKVYINLVMQIFIIQTQFHSFLMAYNILTNLLIQIQDKPGPHACGYCGLRYVLKEGHH